MKNTVQSAIDAAAACGIIVEFTQATEEDEFHRASAHFAIDTTSKPQVCFRSDPEKAIAGAVDALVQKTPGTTMQ